jgi:putative heme transporter
MNRMDRQLDDAEPHTTPATESPAPAPGVSWARRLHLPPVRKELRWTFTAIVLIFVFEYLLLPEIASARRSVKLLGEVDVPLLIVAVLLEALALAAYAQLSYTVLSPGAPKRFRLWRINMSSLAVSHVLPGGTAPGTALAYRLLGESGVSGSTAAFGLATQGVGSAVVLNVLFWAALVISIPLDGFNPLYGFAALAGVFLLGAFGTAVYMLTKGQRGASVFLRRISQHLPFVNPDTVASLTQKVADRLKILMRDRSLLRAAILWATANWILDAASLWVFLWAFGKPIFPIDLLVAYGLANILAAIPITPGGLGIVEGVLIPTLVGFGVPKEVAILGVLSYRFVNFWLPIPIGGASYLSLRFGPQGRRARALRVGNGTAGAPSS